MVTELNSSPVIGISGAVETSKSVLAMHEQILRTGAIPELLDPHERAKTNDPVLGMHALVVMGNDLDIDPSHYVDRYSHGDLRRRVHPATNSELLIPSGRTRAEFETKILRRALEVRMPILAICGGMQRLNVLCGGTLHQHVPDLAGSDKHAQHQRGVEPNVPVIPILVVHGTVLAEIASDLRMPFLRSHCKSLPKVVVENAMHHQAVDIVAPGLTASALSDAFPRPDGTVGYMIEAIEPDPTGPYAGQFVLGVQWHPEFTASDLGPRIIARLVTEASSFEPAASTKP